MSRRYVLALDLKDDPRLIAEYEAHHSRVWPEILDSIRQSGILSMDIYRLGTRLMMIMDVADDFSFERKAAADQADPKVQEWESLMWRYQQAVPGGPPGAKWQLMERIFDFPGTRLPERDGAPPA
jgi:L-rhamnose mutarotase